MMRLVAVVIVAAVINPFCCEHLFVSSSFSRHRLSHAVNRSVGESTPLLCSERKTTQIFSNENLRDFSWEEYNEIVYGNYSIFTSWNIFQNDTFDIVYRRTPIEFILKEAEEWNVNDSKVFIKGSGKNVFLVKDGKRHKVRHM